MPSHTLSVPSQSGIRGIRAYLGLLGLPPWPAQSWPAQSCLELPRAAQSCPERV